MEIHEGLKKEELKELLLKKEAELAELRPLKDENKALKDRVNDIGVARDNAINVEYNIRKEIEKHVKEKQTLTNERDHFKKELDVLADLFNEYVIAYKDQVAMLSVFVNNSKSILQLLELKIEKYNARQAVDGKEK